MPPSSTSTAPGPRALLVTSNGAGMGHLTRLLAYARRLGEAASSHVFSLSTAVGVIGQVGASWEYCPSHAGFPGATTAPWHRMLEERLLRSIDRFRPDVVVFDGTSPYNGLLRARLARPAVPFVWSRRAMWRSDVSARPLDRAQFFDAVVEPGELAGEYDHGPTTRCSDAVRVDPVTLLDAAEALPRGAAREQLGLPADRPALLLTLGAGNINDTASDVGAVVAAMTTRHPDWVVAMTRAPIRTAADRVPDGVHVVSAYPLARLLPAFDAAVSAAGYNAVHELVTGGVPTVFVPNLRTGTDDQLARARWVGDRGAGWCSVDLAADAARLLAELVDDEERVRRGAVARAVARPNGAAAAAALVAATARSG